MRITSVESRIVEYDISELYPDGLPAEVPSAMHRYSVDTIQTDSGVQGHTMQLGALGEGRSIGHVVHDTYAPFLIGADPLLGEAIWQRLRRLNRSMYNMSDAVIGAIDIALWDIRGKVAGLPIATMLGRARDTIPTYATASTVDPVPEQVYEEAARRKADGYRGFKVQFWDGPARDIPRFRAAREAVGPDFPLMQDAGGMYRYADAVASGHALDELDYHWFEEPVPDRQIDQLRRLTNELRVPILAGETSHLHELPEFLRHGAADMIRGDVLIKAGITGLRKAAATAELFGYNLEVHGMPSALLEVANLHVALSIDNCEFVETHHPIYYRGLIGDPLAIDADGCRHLPDGPGLGVSLDLDWIDDHTIEVLTTPSR